MIRLLPSDFLHYLANQTRSEGKTSIKKVAAEGVEEAKYEGKEEKTVK